MLPRDLKPEQFNGYLPEARKLVTGYISALQRLPLSFLPSLLREVIDYDFKFPVERGAVERELANLNSLTAEQVDSWFQAFARIQLSPKLEGFDWINAPAQFVEQLSSYLWTTHQLDAFRTAAMDYAGRLQTAVPPEPPAIPRLGITVVGQGVAAYDQALFRKVTSAWGVFQTREAGEWPPAVTQYGGGPSQGAPGCIRALVYRRRPGIRPPSRYCMCLL